MEICSYFAFYPRQACTFCIASSVIKKQPTEVKMESSSSRKTTMPEILIQSKDDLEIDTF